MRLLEARNGRQEVRPCGRRRVQRAAAAQQAARAQDRQRLRRSPERAGQSGLHALASEVAAADAEWSSALGCEPGGGGEGGRTREREERDDGEGDRDGDARAWQQRATADHVGYDAAPRSNKGTRIRALLAELRYFDLDLGCAERDPAWTLAMSSLPARRSSHHLADVRAAWTSPRSGRPPRPMRSPPSLRRRRRVGTASSISEARIRASAQNKCTGLARSVHTSACTARRSSTGRWWAAHSWPRQWRRVPTI